MIEHASTRWYVAQTHPHAENKAEQHLERQGYGVYLPRYLKRRRHARRIEDVPAPLFPRYLFVAADAAAQRWRSIQSTCGVAHLVCNGEHPAAMDGIVVDNLKRRENEFGFIQMERAPSFQPGDLVRVLDGPFSLSLGLYEGSRDSDRVAILLDLLGRKVRVLLDADLVVAG